MDVVSKEVRSRMMAGIRGSDTLPEMKVRRLLHRHGFRYRLHPRELPGRPDVVLPATASAYSFTGVSGTGIQGVGIPLPRPLERTSGV